MQLRIETCQPGQDSRLSFVRLSVDSKLEDHPSRKNPLLTISYVKHKHLCQSSSCQWTISTCGYCLTLYIFKSDPAGLPKFLYHHKCTTVLHWSHKSRTGPTTYRSFNYRNPILDKPMEFQTENPCTTHAMKSNLAEMLSHSEQMFCRVSLDVSAKYFLLSLHCRNQPLRPGRRCPVVQGAPDGCAESYQG